MSQKSLDRASGRIVVSLISLAIVTSGIQPGLADEKIPVDQSADFRGKVTDEANKPLAHVKIRLTDKVTGKVKTSSSNGQGLFWISTQSPHPLAMEFEPAEKKGLATALFDNLPAREDRQLFVHLAKGFPVTGRVTFGGRALKSMLVRALPEPPDDEHEKIYGVGKATSAGDGTFRMVLTPGRKRLVIYNTLYSNIAKESNRPITVTSDLPLGDIDLRGAQ